MGACCAVTKNWTVPEPQRYLRAAQAALLAMGFAQEQAATAIGSQTHTWDMAVLGPGYGTCRRLLLDSLSCLEERKEEFLAYMIKVL